MKAVEIYWTVQFNYSSWAIVFNDRLCWSCFAILFATLNLGSKRRKRLVESCFWWVIWIIGHCIFFYKPSWIAIMNIWLLIDIFEKLKDRFFFSSFSLNSKDMRSFWGKALMLLSAYSRFHDRDFLFYEFQHCRPEQGEKWKGKVREHTMLLVFDENRELISH